MSTAPDTSAAAPTSAARSVLLALGLSMGAAVSLGITRFAYGLLLPPMRDDLGWSYALAGGMNTANALGYLLGALCTPALMRRWGAGRLLVGGAVLASVFMGASGFFTGAPALLVQRLLAGVASAWVFVAGGLLAARLAAEHPAQSGFLLGLYYGGTGLGIVVSALGVPPLLAWGAGGAHAWRWAWWGLAIASLIATVLLAATARALPAAPAPGAGGPASAGAAVPLRRLGWAMAGYLCFGAGYIGYMTFVIALLRTGGASATQLTLFYALLGVAVVASSRLWAGVLGRWRGGEPQALLNALLGVATLLPVLSPAWPVALASGLLFGAVFLTVVASTTALVRHDLPPAQWAAGISAFTILFALGQIVGPTMVGWIADGPGGLARGLIASALALWLGAALAWRQKALA